MEESQAVAAVERAMVAIRRSQSRRAIQRLAGDTQLDPALFAVIDAVEEGPGAATVSAVADRMGIDQPRASRLVARAVEAGLLRRVADPADGRRSILELTGHGSEQTDQVHRFRREVFGAAMRGWPERDQREFARLLTAFVGALGRPAGPLTDDRGRQL
ncbi:DNA-binding MarR family transcriptional regulator [Streptosporangium album]|uniref:DNA-binding MarR family transcriptional regulator n=1 Tax=Streptosporangium album TaxID=47479 RepID=A0A7W7RVU0_9ACTN|nr:MarR family winged helix-turn-helix transcriptional regulator [Streptosporangium album]MBB4938291.1 DNA-binding MarR family transcriptional regulator [Streptosporangium album]